MKHRALLKLIVCYLVAVVTMFVMLNFFGARTLNRKMLAERVEVLSEEAELIAEEYVTPYYRDATRLSDVLTQLRSVDRLLGTRTWVVSTSGVVIIDTAMEARGRNVDNLDPAFLDRIVAEGYLTEVTFPGVMPQEMLAVAQPIYNNYKLRGYVCTFVSMESVRQAGYEYLDIANICYLVFFVLMLLIFVFLYFAMIYPVGHMTRVTEEYARGRFNVPMKIRSRDEYRDLANAIQFMADEFQRLDEYQKKFVANISHDFRSPLTSIKGYAEAMADGTIPPEQQKKYLDIILFEAERLTKLTSNLLMLSGFDSAGIPLDVTSFDINEVIRRTALTFEGACTKKRITLNLTFQGQELFVDADMGKIQQVLYNLLDNAIKFSNADSAIDIKTEERGSKVFVAVKDYGIGIPKDSINKIWERFYKTDLSRGKDKKGTGLGLSIARDIIQAHRENINAVSTEGVGTEFMFTLPKTVF
ncbi:MAG: HAMP domain-containing histidine kinase [Lachnospiraceae bacterium]|nr:HAMP domain-containing histidine kinase [Lachnospiraceae bacterium]